VFEFDGKSVRDEITKVLRRIYHAIVTETDLRFHEEFIWQKQTWKLMLGAGRRPRPGNNIACNTTERITIYVKPGKPRKFPASVIAADEMPQAIKRDLAQQVWCMIPARHKEHRAPFPERLPARLIRLFAMMRSVASPPNVARAGVDGGGGFPGEIVLDPFCGTGTTCVAAKRMGLQWIGIDRVLKYANMARTRVKRTAIDGGPDLRVGFLGWPKVEASTASTPGSRLGSIADARREAGKAKHKRQAYGRGARKRKLDVPGCCSTIK
jgi:hypothetical protein